MKGKYDFFYEPSFEHYFSDLLNDEAIIHNEDRFSISECKCRDQDVTILGVFDGEGSNKVSRLLADKKLGIANFLSVLSNEKKADLFNHDILRNAFLAYNDAIRGFVDCCGSSSTCSIVIDNNHDKLIVAVVGDSPVVIFKDDGSILSTDKCQQTYKEIGHIKACREKQADVQSKGKEPIYDCSICDDTGEEAVNTTRSFGGDFIALPIPDCYRVVEKTGLLALMTSGLGHKQVTQVLKKIHPNKLKESVINELDSIYDDDATLVFYNLDYKK